MTVVTVNFGHRVTLHYRLSAQDGTEIDSTFGDAPFTLRVGEGELAPHMEQCLIGLTVGHRAEFHLAPEFAFGVSDPALVQQVPQADFADLPETSPGNLIEFELPGGERLIGLVVDRDASVYTIDFNHPLAGCSVCFEVEIIAIEAE